MKKQFVSIFIILCFLANGQKAASPTTIDSLIIKELKTNENVFLLFWISDCPHCDLGIKQLNQKIGNNKVPLITIAFDKDSVVYKNALKEKKMQNFINFCDFKGFEKSVIAKKYAVTQTPTLIAINRNYTKIADGNLAFAKLLI